MVLPNFRALASVQPFGSLPVNQELSLRYIMSYIWYFGVNKCIYFSILYARED